MPEINPNNWLFVRTIGGVFLGELVERAPDALHLTQVIELVEMTMPTPQGMRTVSQLKPATPALSTKIALPKQVVLFDYALSELPRAELAPFVTQLESVLTKIRAAASGLTL